MIVLAAIAFAFAIGLPIATGVCGVRRAIVA